MGVNPQGIGPCGSCTALRYDLFALNSHLNFRVELHLLPAPAGAGRQRTPAIDR